MGHKSPQRLRPGERFIVRAGGERVPYTVQSLTVSDGNVTVIATDPGGNRQPFLMRINHIVEVVEIGAKHHDTENLFRRH
jgi:hypothetical protein